MFTIGLQYQVTENIGREYLDVIEITGQHFDDYTYKVIKTNATELHEMYDFVFTADSRLATALNPYNQEPFEPKAKFEDLF